MTPLLLTVEEVPDNTVPEDGFSAIIMVNGVVRNIVKITEIRYAT